MAKVDGALYPLAAPGKRYFKTDARFQFRMLGDAVGQVPDSRLKIAEIQIIFPAG
jgi:hypothetical protein